LAGLQLKVQAAEDESYQRAQAILLVQDMINRLSANRADAASYVVTTGSGGFVGTGDSFSACDPTSSRSQQDLCEWSAALKGSAERSAGGASLGAMLDARGCVEQVSTNPLVLRVSVAWQSRATLSAPSLVCGQGLYSSEPQRRAIAGIVSVPSLL
jgi:type IV pilus assembly protein PilV